jgi:hypothetical protein
MSALPIPAAPASVPVAADRALGAAFAVCALATLALLASHPAPAGHGLVDLIKAEARDKVRDALVHGGFIVTLAALIVCFTFFSRRLGMERVPVVAGLVAYCIGCGALMLSMLIDGFAVPAIATRFNDAPGGVDLKSAETSFLLCGTLVRFLLPLGLLFQAAAMLAWSAVIVRNAGWRRAVGVFGVAAALLLGATLLAVPPMLEQHLLIGGIVLECLWYLALAGLLYDRTAAIAPSSG